MPLNRQMPWKHSAYNASQPVGKYASFESDWICLAQRDGAEPPKVHEQGALPGHMGGAGAAPKMKMSDALILTGATILLGALFLHAWVTPTPINAEEGPYQTGVNMMGGDSIETKIQVDNQTSLRVVVYDENMDIVDATTEILAKNAVETYEFTASVSGFYTLEIDTDGVNGTINELNVQRKLMLDLLPFPLGAIVLMYGLYLRQANGDEEEKSIVLDAVLETEPNQPDRVLQVLPPPAD